MLVEMKKNKQTGLQIITVFFLLQGVSPIADPRNKMKFYSLLQDETADNDLITAAR